MAETKERCARGVRRPSSQTWGVKYNKAVECLIKDREALLAFLRLFLPEHSKKDLANDDSSKGRSRTIRHRKVRSQGMSLEQDGKRHDL